jgi:hypothetical protein
MPVSFPNSPPAPAESAVGAGATPGLKADTAQGGAGPGGDGLQPDFQSLLSDESSPAASCATGSGPVASKGGDAAPVSKAPESVAAPAGQTGPGTNAPATAGPPISLWNPLQSVLAGLPRVPAKRPASAVPSASPAAALGLGTAQVAAVPAGSAAAGAPSLAPGAARAVTADGLPAATAAAVPDLSEEGPGTTLRQTAAVPPAGSESSTPSALPIEAAAVLGAPSGQTYGAAGRTGAEKSAGPAPQAQSKGDSPEPVSNKNSLVTQIQTVTCNFRTVGTGVAMPSATMPTATPSPQSTPVFAAVLPGPSGMTGGRAAAADAPLALAAGAVENALQVTDLQAAASAGTQSAVNLRFTVAGESLSVRVALQGGQIHTQFRTDSGELRTALAHEWQTVSAVSGTSRFADPVFTAQSRTHAKPDADLGGDGGRQPGQQRNASDRDTDLDKAVLETARGRTPSVSSLEQEPAPANPATRSRLHSFA